MNEKKRKALAALLMNPNKTEAARQAGITFNTLKNYLKDPEFMEEYKRQFSELIEESTRIAQTLINPALQTLHSMMDDTTLPPQARISAAKILLDTSFKLTDKNDILQRLEVLERDSR